MNLLKILDSLHFMNMKDLEKFIKNIHSELKNDNRGKVADYIPELGKVNPELFSISICKFCTDGIVLSAWF